MKWMGSGEEEVSKRTVALGLSMGQTAVLINERQNPAGSGRSERGKRIMWEEAGTSVNGAAIVRQALKQVHA